MTSSVAPRPPRNGAQRDAILRLIDGTRTPAQIAALTGVRRTYVYRVAKRFGREGQLCRTVPGTLAQSLPASVVLRDLCLSPNLVRWLIAQTERGAKIQDVIRGILNDAYQEETGP